MMNALSTNLSLVKSRRKNRLVNQLNSEDRPVHDWYRFVLSFPPHLVREYLKKFNVDSQSMVLDPFSGTGTTIVECKKFGIPAVGMEAHPILHFASETKVDWSPDPEALLKHAKKIAQKAIKALSMDKIDDEPTLRNNKKVTYLRTLNPDAYKLLLSNSIDLLPLHKSLVLLDTIRSNKNNEFLKHETLASLIAVIKTEMVTLKDAVSLLQFYFEKPSF